jgi:hypothetical protein
VGLLQSCLGAARLEGERILRLALRIIFGRLSVFSACSLTSGAVFALSSLLCSSNPWLWFLFGSFIPAAPLLLYFSSTYALRRSIENWKKLREDEIISQQQFAALRRTAIEWYTQRWFGVSSLAEPGKEERGSRQNESSGGGSSSDSSILHPRRFAEGWMRACFRQTPTNESPLSITVAAASAISRRWGAPTASCRKTGRSP